jgi:hypothetical protein
MQSPTHISLAAGKAIDDARWRCLFVYPEREQSDTPQELFSSQVGGNAANKYTKTI